MRSPFSVTRILLRTHTHTRGVRIAHARRTQRNATRRTWPRSRRRSRALRHPAAWNASRASGCIHRPWLGIRLGLREWHTTKRAAVSNNNTAQQSASRSRRTGETEAVRVDHQHADHVAVAEQRGHGGLELLLHGCLEIDGRFVCVIERASGRNEIEEIERDRQRNESLRSPARRLLLYDTIHGARAKTPRRIRG